MPLFEVRFRVRKAAPMAAWARRLSVSERSLYGALRGERRFRKLTERLTRTVESMLRYEWLFIREPLDQPELWRWTGETPEEKAQRMSTLKVLVIDENGIPHLMPPSE